MVDFTNPESIKEYILSTMRMKASQWETRTLTPEDIDETPQLPARDMIEELFGAPLFKVIMEAGLLPWYFDKDFSTMQFSGPEETKQYILSALQQKAAEEAAQKFWPREIENDPRFPSVKEIQKLFGVNLLDNVLRMAGLLPIHPNKDELIAALKAFHEKHGKPPTIRDAEMELLPYSRNIYQGRFGSWNAGLKAAGLPIIEAMGGRNASIGDWSGTSNQEIIDYFRKKYGESGYLPSTATYIAEYKSGKHKYPLELIKKRIGTWRELAKQTKLKLLSDAPPSITKQEVLEYFQKRYGATRRLPTLIEYERSNPKYPYRVINNLFGGFIGLAKRLDYQIARPEYTERCIKRKDRNVLFD